MHAIAGSFQLCLAISKREHERKTIIYLGKKGEYMGNKSSRKTNWSDECNLLECISKQTLFLYLQVAQ